MKDYALKIGDLTAKIPVIQGGMGVGVSLSSLAGTVAANGGVGIISTAQIGYLEEDYDKNPLQANLRAVKKEIDKARKLASGGIIGCNIMVATRNYEDYVKAAVAAGIDLIISGAGLPMKLPEFVANTKTKIAPIVSSVKSVEVIIKYWLKKYKILPDMVVIEGPLAGGHLGFTYEQLNSDLNYDEVIKDIINHVKVYEKEHGQSIPVIVAGGIYDGKDVVHALSLGASGVQVGTRFVTTTECDASMEYKQTYLDAKKEDIVIVKSPVGMPGRAIKNKFLDKVMQGKVPHDTCHACIITCNPKETPYCISEALINAAVGKVEDALLFCGSNAYKAQKIESVKEIMDEYKNALEA